MNTKKCDNVKRKIRTITMSDKVWELAKAKATDLDLSLSSYINYLVLKDK